MLDANRGGGQRQPEPRVEPVNASIGARPDPALAVLASAVAVQIDEVSLLDPVSFELERGRTLAITGPNGSGKTTLLRVLAGAQPQSAGEVAVLGATPDERSPAFRADVAALLGPPPLSRSLTLGEYLALVGTSWGLGLDRAVDQVDELLGELGITQLAHRFAHEISSGQSQLYALALVLARPCAVLLLDEPEQRLDPERLELVARALERRKDDGVSIVLASHSPALVARIADERLELSEDRVTR